MTNESVLLAGIAGLSLAYVGLYWRAVERWALEPSGAASAQRLVPACPRITFFRPLKPGVPDLRAKLEMLVMAARADDQILFGADAGSPEAALCEEVRARFPGRDLAVVRCVPDAARNPKISKLVQMEPHARHEHWLLSDSEALLDAEFCEAFRGEWAESGADALTAAYRFCHARSWPQRLDAAAVLLTLLPGLAVLRGSVKFTLGACTAVRRGEVGGWKRFGDELAEDHCLGRMLAAAGKTVRLSARLATLECDPLGWRDYWRHQRRVAVTYRAANPAGFAASVLVNGELWCALLVARGEPALGLALGAAILAARVLAAGRMARRLEVAAPGLAALLVARAVETVCWAASWFTRTVWWSGRRWRVRFRGKLVCPMPRAPH